LEKLLLQWDDKNIKWEYERILDSALKKWGNTDAPQMGIIRTVQSQWRRLLSMPDKSFTWLRNTDAATEDQLAVDKSITYQPVRLSKKIH
jgi:hypothetical protein